jgi:hypothetical protein
MMKNRIRYLFLFLMLTHMVQHNTVAAELYKYKNEDDVTVLDSHVPARYVKDGYSILSLDGRILEVVPRALSNEEIRERDRLLAEQETADREKRKREVIDQNLLRLYSTPNDVIRARDAKLASIDGLILTQRGNIQRLELQGLQLESELADIQRAGGAISKDALARIRNIEIQIAQVNSEIDNKLDEKEALVASYAADLVRVKELYRR